MLGRSEIESLFHVYRIDRGMRVWILHAHKRVGVRLAHDNPAGSPAARRPCHNHFPSSSYGNPQCLATP
jgi:hypothetical protein